MALLLFIKVELFRNNLSHQAYLAECLERAMCVFDGVFLQAIYSCTYIFKVEVPIATSLIGLIKNPVH